MATAKSNKATAKKLTERDLKILRRIGESGLASFDQLKKLYWPEAKERTARERLNQLEKAGFISAHTTDKRQPDELIFTLDKKGAANFDKQTSQRLQTGLPAAHEIKQQLLAQEARIVLETKLAERGAKIICWTSERELRGQACKTHNRKKPFGTLADIADAAATIQEADGSTHQLAIEIDGQYYGKMLKQKINNFASQGQPTLWVTTGTGRGERIKSETSQIENIDVLVV